MEIQVNSLESAASSYLRSARHQPVQWQEWGEAAFAQAAREDKPVLLDIGAVWCHWCHVMDRESYEDASLAAVINERFIAIKVDRDERPDVDSRYQAAVSAISGQGGWPLTAILTPDGRPYFGGTYFPRDDRYGRPGFERVLQSMADAWKQRRDEVLESAGSIMAAIEHGETFSARGGDLSSGLVAKLVQHAIGQFDPRNGGFGSQPKFPHPAAIDLLLDWARRTGSDAAASAATVTLKKMSEGGVYDQLGGGFHRYSVDERWVVPHFEKMLYDNAGLLANYVHAFQTFVDPEFARVAKDIVRWMDAELTDRERGGFYASQDADVTLDDDGDYFTWTKAEAAAVLTPQEMAVCGLYYDIGDVGDMQHDPHKNVLHRKFTIAEAAERLRLPLEHVGALIESGRTNMHAARSKRTAPYIDKTVYTGWNGMAVSAYLSAGQGLGMPEATAFALKTLDRLLDAGWSEQSGLAHVIAYSEDYSTTVSVAGVLDDYAFLVHACLDAWQISGLMRYYAAAEQLADAMVARFYDRTGGGFFDAELGVDKPIGALAARRKPLQDSPTPAGNPTAAAALIRLEALNGRAELREMAEDTLGSFAGVVEHFGLYAGSYGLALQRLVLDPVQVVVVGEHSDPDARTLEVAALAGFAVNKSVIRLTRAQVSGGEVPPSLAETLPHLPEMRSDVSGSRAFALVCKGKSCLPAVNDSEQLLKALR
ncbi:MAG TPA: thioredoxin domain-containing protein [Acidisarcina sp.]